MSTENDTKCACKALDARDCFIARHPECRRFSDDPGSLYDDAIDEECECHCHIDYENECADQEWNATDEH